MTASDHRPSDDLAASALHAAGNTLTRTREHLAAAQTRLTGARASRAGQLCEVVANLEGSVARLIRSVESQEPGQPA